MTSKQRHADRDRAELIQRHDNELKSLRVRYESNIDLLQKENELKKSQARKTIEELEKKLTMISEKFQGLQRLFESKVQEEQINHQKSIDQLNSEHEEKMKTLRQELRKLNEQLEQQLKQQKEILEQNERTFTKIKTDLESKYQHQVSGKRSSVALRALRLSSRSIRSWNERITMRSNCNWNTNSSSRSSFTLFVGPLRDNCLPFC